MATRGASAGVGTTAVGGTVAIGAAVIGAEASGSAGVGRGEASGGAIPTCCLVTSRRERSESSSVCSSSSLASKHALFVPSAKLTSMIAGRETRVNSGRRVARTALEVHGLLSAGGARARANMYSYQGGKGSEAARVAAV